MLTILHVSDLHFGPPYVPAVGEALLRIAPSLKPDFIVASGDFTQRATRQQFAEARDFLNRLPPVPKVVVPGNHDVPLYRVRERLFDPFSLYREYISSDLDQTMQCNGAYVVSLNSTSPRRALTNGRIRAGQLEFCEQFLRQAPPEAIRVVVAHHHFAPAPDYEADRAMPKAKRAMDRFVELGVDLILGGHLHRAYIGNSLDIYPGPERDRGIIIVQCGTTTSRRGRGKEREKNTFNVISVAHEMFRITHFMYFDDAHGFAPVSRHIFPRPGKRFVDHAASA